MNNIIQGSPEWFSARLGKVTASRVADVVAKTKTGYSTSRQNYLAELALERLTGTRAEGFTSADMQWGTDNEADARIAYEFQTGHTVTEIGFVPHPTISASGASPDGLISDVAVLELKCPKSATHLESLRTMTVSGRYQTQIQWQLACTGREWADFASFDPRFPPHLQLWVSRVMRDDKRIAELETEVQAFLLELDEALDDLRVKYEAAA